MIEGTQMLRLQEWNTRLGEASSADEVLWVVRDYLSRWTPQQLEDLPADCRPGQMAHPQAIADYAMQLQHAQSRSDDIVASRLYTMATFFGLAAHRLAQIAHFNARIPRDQKEKH